MDRAVGHEIVLVLVRLCLANFVAVIEGQERQYTVHYFELKRVKLDYRARDCGA